MTKEKIYKDLLDRKIKIKDCVLHLWIKTDSRGYPTGGVLGVKYKIATVIKFTDQGIGIKWINHRTKKEKHSTIYNTKNKKLKTIMKLLYPNNQRFKILDIR